MYTFIYALCAVGQATLAVLAIRAFRRRRSLSGLALALPIIAVVWDNSIIALGSVIGAGPTLVGLSWPRFVGHALLTPVWILTAIGFARRSGGRALEAPWARIGQWVAYAVCVGLGLLRSVVFLVMELTEKDGLVSYRNAGTFPGPPFGSIIMLFVVLACAVVVAWRLRTPWMLLCSAFMLVVSVAPLGGVGAVAGNFGELVMAGGLVATEYILQRRTSGPARLTWTGP